MDKPTKKEQKFYDFLFMDGWAVLGAIEKFFKDFFTSATRKIKDKKEEYGDIWEFVDNFKSEDSFSEELKIITAAVFIIIFSFWINNNNSIPVAHSESDFEMTNAQTKELPKTEETESDGKKVDVGAINKYKIESSKESCEKNKEEKKSSSLCGKDDEEELQKIAEETKKEKKAQTIKASKPRINAPQPYVYEKDSAGRKVCNKKNDHPSKSKNNKKGHMDMECCLDPDEIPNPNCYYGSKYAKYLK